MTKTNMSSAYRGFADLANSQIRDKDYRIVTRVRNSSIAVIAPHGGRIEPGTSKIVRAIAAKDFNFYLFEGIKPSDNYDALHLRSHFFDEPQCLEILAKCSFVVAIHGCKGVDERVLLGGLDTKLMEQIAVALTAEKVPIEKNGHPFPAAEKNNICNRGLSLKGVQLEITHPLRFSVNASRIVTAVRSVLADLDSVI